MPHGVPRYAPFDVVRKYDVVIIRPSMLILITTCPVRFYTVQGFLSAGSPDPLWGSGAIDLAGSGPVHMTGGVTYVIG